MKKYIFISVIVVLLSVIGIGNFNISKNSDWTNLTFANIEALASTEWSYGGLISCYREITYSGNGPVTHATYCGSCDPQICRSWSYEAICRK